jgi:protein-tyrosine phosphatase
MSLIYQVPANPNRSSSQGSTPGLLSQLPQQQQPSNNNRRKRRSGLYIGGKSDAKNYDKITNHWNVTHILNMTPAKETGVSAGVPNYFEKTSKLVYHRIPVYDVAMCSSELLQQADTIVNFIATGLCHGSVLVHCQRGISRSTTAVLFYLMRYVMILFNRLLIG